MAQEVRLWEISGNDRLNEVTLSELNLEARIENWLEDDINVIKTNNAQNTQSLLFTQATQVPEEVCT